MGHSTRRAVTGDTRVARRAGIKAATSVTATIPTEAASIGHQPPAGMFSSIVTARRCPQSAAGTPAIKPRPTSRNASPSTIRLTSAPRCAKRHANADFTRPAHDRIGDEAIQACRGEQGPEHSKEAGQRRQQTLRHDGGIDLIRERREFRMRAPFMTSSTANWTAVASDAGATLVRRVNSVGVPFRAR